MKKNKLGKTNIEVTPVGMGVLTIGKTQLNLNTDVGASVLRYALEKGINFLDTAQYYETYHFIKEALKGTNYNPVIASKSLHPSYSQMEQAIEEARKALDRDVIDIFMLHEVRGEEDFKWRIGAWECLNDAKAKGLVKAIGISTHHVDVAELNANIKESDVLFPLINFKSLGIRKYDGTGTKEEMARAIEENAKKDKGVFAMKVFGGGNLTGSYLEALDYATSLNGISSLMVGLGKQEEVDRIVEYMEGTIDRTYTPDISKKRIRIEDGNCEGCGACIKKCPNHAISYNKFGMVEVNHDLCLTCGYCAPVCPVRAIIMF